MNCSPSFWKIIPAVAKTPNPRPCRSSLRVSVRRAWKQIAPSTSTPNVNRGSSVEAVMNQELPPGTRRSCRSTSDLISGKLTPHSRLPSSSIQMAWRCCAGVVVVMENRAAWATRPPPPSELAPYTGRGSWPRRAIANLPRAMRSSGIVTGLIR